MFFISPQIFQIEYSENMNEMEVLCEALILMGCDLGLQGWKLQGLTQISGDLWFRMSSLLYRYMFSGRAVSHSLSLSQWAVYIL